MIAAHRPAATAGASRAPPGVTAVAERGCRVLSSIAGSDAGKQAVIAADGPAAIVAALRAHPGNQHIHGSVLVALRRMGFDGPR